MDPPRSPLLLSPRLRARARVKEKRPLKTASSVKAASRSLTSAPRSARRLAGPGSFQTPTRSIRETRRGAPDGRSPVRARRTDGSPSLGATRGEQKLRFVASGAGCRDAADERRCRRKPLRLGECLGLEDGR